VGHEIVEAYGGTVCVTGMVEGISTSHIMASLARGTAAERVEGAPADDAAPSQASQTRFRRAG
jgi:hypothetical protein